MHIHPRSGERGRRAAALAASVLLLSAACSSDDSGAAGDEVLERLIASAGSTREAGTARIYQTIEMEFPERDPGDEAAPGVAGGRVTVTAEGLVDLRGRRGRMSVSTEGEGLAGADALGGDMDLVLDGEAMYMRSPFYSQLAPDHEPWLRVTFEELRLRGMSQLGQQDPLAFVEALRGVHGDAEEIGEDEVRGESVTHYRATIVIDRMLRRVPDDARPTVAAQFEQLGIREMPIDVWLDADGRVRRMVTDVTLAGETMRGGSMKLLLELDGFGVAFDLRLPPPGQVAEFGDVFGEAENRDP